MSSSDTASRTDGRADDELRPVDFRGYSGRLPVLTTTTAGPAEWARALTVPVVIGVISLIPLIAAAGTFAGGAS